MAYNEPSVTDLSTTGLLSIRQIVGDRKRGVQPIISISRSGFLAGVRAGVYPRGVLLGKRRLWTSDSIRALITELAAGEVSP